MIGSAPTGIDRVEHAYATEIISKPSGIESVGVITTPLFTGALRKPLIQEVLGRVALAWKTGNSPREDALYLKLKEYLETPVQLARTQSFRVADLPLLQRTRDQAIFPVRSLARASTRLKRWVRRGVGQANFYLNSSHTQLEKVERFEWTKAASIKCVFFIHDLIPIDFPEYVSPRSPARHEGRLNTVSRLASGISVNSDYTARSVAAYLDARKTGAPPIEVIPLGVTEWFLDKSKLHPPQATAPYFVNVSTIEPRKNMLFLFAVWRRLIETLGPTTPRLVLIGHRGWENENVIDVLDRSRGLAPFLVEASGLSDDGLSWVRTVRDFVEAESQHLMGTLSCTVRQRTDNPCLYAIGGCCLCGAPCVRELANAGGHLGLVRSARLGVARRVGALAPYPRA